MLNAEAQEELKRLTDPKDTLKRFQIASSVMLGARVPEEFPTINEMSDDQARIALGTYMQVVADSRMLDGVLATMELLPINLKPGEIARSLNNKSRGPS